MELYRITQAAYADDLSGNGSRLFGGRWNSKGYYALYTSGSRSLALLETLAHIPAKLFRYKTYMLVTVSIPGPVPKEIIEQKDLPDNWDTLDVQNITQVLGDKFLLQEKKLMLQVPSVFMPEENNYVINPLHPAMKRVRIIHQREIKFNDRLIRGN